MFPFVFSSPARGSGFTEYQLKAAFIYNFVKFVDWPSSAFTNADSPYVIGVLGDNVFGDNFKPIIAGKKINGRGLIFVTCNSAADAANCQVLFISRSERFHFKEILAELHGNSILTISEADNFIKAGGIIDFKTMPDSTIRFQINQSAAREAGLQISSDLLNLALPPD